MTRFSRSRPGKRTVETSIVIRMFNEEKHLQALYDGLARQTYRDFEIVVVDSGSFDRSREISERHVDTLAQIASHDFTFGHALNVGIKHSRGDFIVIVSAHTVPTDRNWLGNMIEPLCDERTAMAYGCQRGAATSKFGEVLDFERTFGTSAKVLSPPNYFGNNANSAIRRELWLQHPFDETLPGLEDIEWVKHWMERGYLVVYEPQAAIYHIHEESWPQVRRRYYREGQAAKWIGIRGRRDLPREICREAAWFASDLVEAMRQGKLLTRGREIGRFRYEKLVGTCKGILGGARMDNLLKREGLLFDMHYKAVVISSAGRASLESMELSQIRPSEVLIRVAYQAVCATDLEILDGNLGYYKDGLASYPIVPGHEFSGVVTRVGARVTDLREGDHVVVECIQGCGQCDECRRENAIGCKDRREVGVIGRNGGYAEYVVTPGRFVHRLPPDVGLREAALCEPLAVVLKGLRRLGRATGEHPARYPAAVIGAGPIGHLAALLLHHRGYAVTVFDRDKSRLAHFEGTAIKVLADLTGLGRFDLIIEATGNVELLDRLLAGAKAGTTVLLLGFPYGERPFSFERIVGFDLSIVGSVGSSASDFKEAIRMLPKLDLSAFFQMILPLSEYAVAWEVARSRKHLKVVLRVDEALDKAVYEVSTEPLRAVSE